MRSFVIFLVLAISVVIFGEASNAQTAKDVTYVLIDKSGSMDLTSKKHTVDVELSRIISEATEGSEISITHFGSSNGGDCKSVVEVSPLTTVQPNLVLPYAPDPRGGTPLVAALDAVFEKVKGQSATIQIITDGSASCGKEDVCSTAFPACRSYTSRRGSIDLRLRRSSFRSSKEPRVFRWSRTA